MFPVQNKVDNRSLVDRVLGSIEQLVDGDDVARGQTALALAEAFQADAVGLYAVSQPGSPLELLSAHALPDSMPRRLGSGVQNRIMGYSRSIIQAHAIDPRGGIWTDAAQESGWQELMVQTLPHCPAWLLLAYRGRAPNLPAEQINTVLHCVSLAVRQRQALAQVRALGRHNDELVHTVDLGIDLLGDGVFILDDQACIQNCNQGGAHLLGYECDEIIGLPVDGVLVSRSEISALVQQVLAGRNAREDLFIVLFQRYGESISGRLQVAPLRLPSQAAPFGAVITFSVRRLEQMDAVESNLRQQNAQLERMMSVLAHEIRNPLGSIKAGLDYLEPMLAHDQEAREDLRTIKSEIGRLDRLLRDALLVSRPSEPRFVPQQVTDLLDDLLIGREKLLVGRSISVRRNYQDQLPRTPLDRALMEQVFDNLIVNALHAMSEGGELTLSVSASTIPSGERFKQRPVIEVKIGDTGPGISPEIQDRIFDPFFTTKKGGTGLGLAVARRIVGQHNGSLKVESWLGIGTIFTIILPVEEALCD